MKLSMILIGVLCLLFTMGIENTISAQEHEPIAVSNHNKGGHRLTLVMGYAFLDNSFSEETNVIRVVPAIGLNYDYFIKPKWGFGVHSDILIQQFKVELHNNDEEVIRENPVALCGMILYRPHHRWLLFSGYGVEIERHENLQLLRIGAEYGIELPKNWELGFSLEFDFKPDAYNSLMFGVGFSHLFVKDHKRMMNQHL